MAALLVTAGFAAALVWNDDGKFKSIGTRELVDRAATSLAVPSHTTSVGDFESHTLVATERDVTPALEESIPPDVPIADIGKDKRVACLEDVQPTEIEPVEPKPARIEIAHAEVSVEPVAAQTPETIDVMKLLRRALKTTTDPSVEQQVTTRLDALTMDLAEKWAEEGRELSALRLLRQVETAAIDASQRELAGRRIAQIRSRL